MDYDETIKHAAMQIQIYEKKHGKRPDYVVMNYQNKLILDAYCKEIISFHENNVPYQTIEGIKIMIDDTLPDEFIKAVGE